MFARQFFRACQPAKQVSSPKRLSSPKRRAAHNGWLALRKVCVADKLQSFRKYSTEAPKGKANLTPIYLAVGVAGLAVGTYRYAGSAAAEEKPRDKVFKGGDQGFVDLKLAAIEELSPNTKKFRFEFEDKDAVSGLPVTCESFSPASIIEQEAHRYHQLPC